MTSSDSAVEGQGTILWPDFLDAHRLHTTGTGMRRILARVTVALMIASITFSAFVILGNRSIRTPFVWSLLLITVYVVQIRWVIPRRLHRYYQQQRVLHEPFRITLDAEGFHCVTPSVDSRRQWGDFIRWQENASVILLYQTDIMYNLIPKAFFASPVDAERASTLIRAHMGPTK